MLKGKKNKEDRKNRIVEILLFIFVVCQKFRSRSIKIKFLFSSDSIFSTNIDEYKCKVNLSKQKIITIIIGRKGFVDMEWTFDGNEETGLIPIHRDTKLINFYARRWTNFHIGLERMNEREKERVCCASFRVNDRIFNNRTRLL